MCAYLMEHGATEFSDNNLKRAVMCLSPKTRLDSGLSVSDVVISFTYGSDDRGSDITLEEALDKGAHNWYLPAEEALSRRLVAALV